jgi:hypothetical protein
MRILLLRMKKNQPMLFIVTKMMMKMVNKP